jgi:hypothetical protein
MRLLSIICQTDNHLPIKAQKAEPTTPFGRPSRSLSSVTAILAFVLIQFRPITLFIRLAPLFSDAFASSALSLNPDPALVVRFKPLNSTRHPDQRLLPVRLESAKSP